MKIILSLTLLLLLPQQLSAQSDPVREDIIQDDGSLGTFRIQTNEDLEHGNEREQQRQEEVHEEQLQKDHVHDHVEETEAAEF
jgi:hypothetical protein